MSEDRRRILDMLAEGKITVSEAEQLLNAIGAPITTEPTAGGRTFTAVKSRPRYLRVLVQGQHNGHGREHGNVDVRVPLQLLRSGMKFASLIPQEAQGQITEELGRKGIHLNLADMTPEMVEELIGELGDLEININDDEGSSVRVYCE